VESGEKIMPQRGCEEVIVPRGSFASEPEESLYRGALRDQIVGHRRHPLRTAGTTHTNGLSVSEDIKSLASLRGRIGYTWADGLLYFTGGGAWESISTSAMISANTAPGVFGQSATGSVTNTRSGYVIGGGVEWMVARNWTVRGEYLYYNFTGADTFALPIANCAIPGCGVNVTTASNNINVFRLGANYKFDWFR
jgi:opacity protein-like surface antigen